MRHKLLASGGSTLLQTARVETGDRSCCAGFKSHCTRRGVTAAGSTVVGGWRRCCERQETAAPGTRSACGGWQVPLIGWWKLLLAVAPSFHEWHEPLHWPVALETKPLRLGGSCSGARSVERQEPLHAD